MKRIAELWKNTNIVIKIIIIFIIIAIFGIFSIYRNYINNKNNNETINGEIAKENEYISSYEVNQAGLYRDSQIIIEEKFNEKNDLIYSKYKDNNGKIVEDNYAYSYDNQDRITKIDYNTGESSLIIKYAQGFVSQIIAEYNDGKKEFNYIYRPDNITVIEEYYTPYYKLGNIAANTRNLTGRNIIVSKTTNNKKYNLLTKFDENKNAKSQILYEENIEPTSSFLYLGLLPIQYLGTTSTVLNYQFDVIQPYVGFGASFPVINGGNVIKIDDEIRTEEKVYDKSGRILADSTQENNSMDSYNLFLYKYEPIDNNSYYKYYLIDGGKYFNVLGLKQQYSSGKEKVYLNNSGNINKIETIETNDLLEEEYNTQKEEFTVYISQNKVDTSEIYNDFFENTNGEGITIDVNEYNNPNIESNSTPQNNVKELSNEEKKTIAKGKLDSISISIDNGEGDAQVTYFSPLNYNISASYSIDDTIDFKIEKVIVVNEQTGVSQEIVNNSDSTYIGNVSVDLMDGQNKIVFSFYDNYGNVRQIIKNVNKLNF